MMTTLTNGNYQGLLVDSTVKFINVIENQMLRRIAGVTVEGVTCESVYGANDRGFRVAGEAMQIRFSVVDGTITNLRAI